MGLLGAVNVDLGSSASVRERAVQAGKVGQEPTRSFSVFSAQEDDHGSSALLLSSEGEAAAPGNQRGSFMFEHAASDCSTREREGEDSLPLSCSSLAYVGTRDKTSSVNDASSGVDNSSGKVLAANANAHATRSSQL